MKIASDFRSLARTALAGKWKVAVIAGLIAALLGAVASNGLEINWTVNDSKTSFSLEYAGQQVYTFGEGIDQELAGIITAGAIYVSMAALVMAAVSIFIGSVVGIGYARFNLDLVDLRKEPQISTLFDYFSYWKTAVVTNLLRGLYIFLWSLLFVVPGVIAAFNYAMTSYIIAEHPELSAKEAMERSKQMMYGNRFRLFCLQLSFIGWDLLSALTLGIGSLWLTPYKQAAEAIFYRDICGLDLAQGALHNEPWENAHDELR